MRAALLISILSLTALAEDSVTFHNGDHLTGKVVGLSDGFIRLKSPHSEAPLEILSKELKSLSFEKRDLTELPTHPHQVNLRNGDVIPGEISGLNDKALELQTWFAGPISIPRNQIDSVYYGVTPQRLLYSGPKELNDWTHDDDWEFNKDTLRSNDRGSIGRNMNLPDRFIFSTVVSWQNSPNLRIHFCSDATDGQKNTEAYYLQLNSQGIQIYRNVPSEDGKSSHPVILGGTTKRANDFTKRQALIEVRVDRSTNRIILYTDGERQGEATDPHPVPTGSNIIFESQSSGRQQATVSKIEIREWDAVTQLLRREPRTDKSTDTLATDEGDRYSGQILERIDHKGKPAFKVQSPLLEQAIFIPEDRSSVLYFAQDELPGEKKASYSLSLSGNGKLKLSEITLSDDKLQASHPWLGKLTLDRRALNAISSEELPKAKPSSKSQ
ncbi:MAG: hypothetical protein ACSHYF_03230 [Verrucomicrobiaceae bacterium]